MAPPTTNQDYLGSTFIICAFLSAILAGFSTIQGYLYFRNFQKDPLWLKYLIAVIWILDALHISLILGSVHNTFVTHFNDPAIFQTSFPNVSLAFDVAFVMGTLSMALVLAFHSYRVKLVTPNRILQWGCFVVTGTRNMLLLLLAVLSCVAVATTWTSTQSSATTGETSSSEHGTNGESGGQFLSGWTGSLLLATVALSTLSDVNGTIIVSASLWKHREEKLTSTRHLVTKIILYTVQTGACRAIFMFSLLISIIFAPINISGWTGSLLLATVALSTLSDVNGTIIVSASLWKHREEKLTSTRHLVTKIILYTVQTGACRAIFMFSLLISIIFAPINISWIVLVILGPRVYSNSLLTTLNTRVNLTSSNQHVLDSKGVSFYYVGADLESIQFEGGPKLDKTSLEHELRVHETQVRKYEAREEEEGGSKDLRGDRLKGQPKLDMTTISLSGSTPPVSPVVDLDLPRDGGRDEVPALPGDEAVLVVADVDEDCVDALRVLDGHPDWEKERVVFAGRGRFFTLNTPTSSHPNSLPPSGLTPTRFSDTLSQKGPQGWEEAGDGDAYLLRDRQSGRVRFVFVGEGDENQLELTVVASHEVKRTLDLHHTPFSDRSWTWRTNATSNHPSLANGARWINDDRVALRFDDVEAAYAFRSAFYSVER